MQSENGWFGQRIVCPNCDTPFSEVATKSRSATIDDTTEITTLTLEGVCPDCGERKVKVDIERVIGPA